MKKYNIWKQFKVTSISLSQKGQGKLLVRLSLHAGVVISVGGEGWLLIFYIMLFDRGARDMLICQNINSKYKAGNATQSRTC